MLLQRRSVQGSAQQANNTDTSSSVAVSFLIGGSALNEACDVLAAQSSQSSASFAQTVDPQNQTNDEEKEEDHCRKLAALYQKGKSAYNIICRADDAASAALPSEIMPIMTTGNASSAGNSQSSATSSNNTPLPRSRGSFLGSTPHGGHFSKLTPGVARKKPSIDVGGNVGGRMNRSLSDASDVSNNSSSTPGSGDNRGGGKNAISNNPPAKKHHQQQQQQQQQPRKSDPPPDVLNFLKKLNAGGSSAAGASAPPSSTTTAAATNNINDTNTKNSRKRPPASYVPKPSTERPPPPPPSSTDDEEHNESNQAPATATTRRTRSKRANSRTAASLTTADNTRVYDIGESVFVQVKGKHYNAIIKNVDFKEGSEDDEDDAMKQRAVYEVEFSDGEVWEDVGGDDVHSADEEE